MLILAIALILGGIAFVIWSEHAAERSGSTWTAGRLARFAIILLGIGSLYWVLVQR